VTDTQSSPSKNRDTPNTGYEHLAPLFEQLAALDEHDPNRSGLRNELVTGHLPLAEHIAARFSNRGVPREDLVQVATLGLINAVDRFQPDRGTDFLSFAVPTVMGEVRRHFRDASWSMHVPRRLKELNLAINAASAELSQRLGRAPTPSELARHLDLSQEQVYEGLEAGNAYHSMSLDEALSADADSDALGETLGETDAALDGVEDYESLRPLIEQLPERERTILTLRFFRHMTQTQIADRIGISQMHVSRLLARTLEQLREGMLVEEED
jgi:RNA polymerase sigma-B factor